MEIVSRYLTSTYQPYHNGFLDYAFDKSISINPGGVYIDTITWNGNDHSDYYGNDFGDIANDNIQVIIGVFNSDNDYVDETFAAIPTLDSDPPHITNVVATPSIQIAGESVEISANITDASDLNEVKTVITYPDNSTANETMTLAGGDIYTFSTTYLATGTYNYYIWAEDIVGLQQTSIVQSFNIVNPEITDTGMSWNLISIPFNDTQALNDIIVQHAKADYTWQEATTVHNFLDPNVFGWERTNPQSYFTATELAPGEGYWIYGYSPCTLVADNVSITYDSYITTFPDSGWKILSAPDNEVVNTSDITVTHDATDYSWADAVSLGIIDGNLFGWDQTTQTYFTSTTFDPGYGYWLYSDESCVLKQ
jgi:hypothetical protein